MAVDREAPSSDDREILITRTFDAPVELVWRAWTDPQRIGQWWGPRGFSTTTYEMDVRPGGQWRFDMHGPDGRDYSNRVVFDEVREPHRLVYTQDGRTPDLEEVSFQSTVTFERQGDQTKLTLRMVFASTADRDRVCRQYGAVEGGIETLARLADHVSDAGEGTGLTIALPNACELVIARRFDAPRHLVYDAMTNSEWLKRWLLGPPGWSMDTCECDVRVGGRFRHHWRNTDGAEMAMSGVYQELVPPERIVQTETFEFGCDAQAGEQHATLVLTEQDNGTAFTLTIRYPSQQARDATIASGVDHGLAATYDRLAEILVEQRA